MDYVNLFGSGRDISTRAVRRANHSRELQIRIGPWVIRPARRVAVAPLRLEEYLEVLGAKVADGVIVVQAPDLTPMSMDALKALIQQLKFPEGIEGEQLGAPFKEVDLHTPAGTGTAPDRELALDAEALLDAQLSMTDGGVADPVAGSSDVVEGTPEGTESGAPSLDAEDSAPDAPALVGDEPSTVEHETEDAVYGGPAPTLDAPSSSVISGRSLPDGWKDLSNKNLVELAKLNNVTLPDKAAKATMIAALEAWVGGN